MVHTKSGKGERENIFVHLTNENADKFMYNRISLSQSKLVLSF